MGFAGPLCEKMNDKLKNPVNNITEQLFSEKAEGIEESLRQAGFTNVRSVEHSLRLIVQQTGTSPALLNKIIGAAGESFHPDAGLNGMERYLSASDDRSALCSCLEKEDESVTALMALFSGSQLLTDSFLQMELSLDWLTSCITTDANGGERKRTRSVEDLWNELSGPLEQAGTLEQKGRFVRSFKKKEYIRIGLRDLLKKADTAETIRALSNLADVCLEAAYTSCHQELLKRNGTPLYTDLNGQEKECRFSILGLGKLGGLELNFSSDIDIIYLYTSDEGSTEGKPGPGGNRVNNITNHEYFSRLGTMITNFMSEITPEGNIFRVDLRLRPEGTMGDIAYSLRSYEIYYESYGVTLERQALIKARLCAGDIKLGEQFLDMVKPFIFRKHLDYTAIEEVKQMKESIDRRLSRDDKAQGHVKLGYGGIREIEFVIQAFQLVHGGRDESIQRNNSLEALDSLHRSGYLDSGDHSALNEAYLFLRDLENRIQISHGLQTHTIPGDEKSQAILARKMGMVDGDVSQLAGRLMSEYERRIETVRAVYNNFFYSTAKEEAAEEISLDLEDRETALHRLAAVGFGNPDRALDNFLLLRDGPIFSHPSERSKLSFSYLLPNLTQLLPQLPDPDMALNHLERFINGSRSRETLLSLLLEETQLLNLLMRLFGNSEILSNFLIQQPNLLDVMLQTEGMVSFKSRDRFQDELLHTLQPIEEWEEKLSELRKYKQAEDLRVGLKYIAFSQDVLETVTELSNLAEAILRVALVMVEAELIAKYGVPVTQDGLKSRTAVIGMGKLGGREMSFGSDLDILLVFSGDGHTKTDPNSPADIERLTNHTYYTHLYELLLNAISAVTADGYAYKIDMRLRPEGDKGSLALPLAKFEDYFDREEQAWVRQAMIKARPVAGDPELGNRFIASAHRFTYMKGFGPAQAGEIAHNRVRMEKELAREIKGHRDLKHGLGGITDIEFAVQLLQLKHGGRCPKIRTPGTLSTLNELQGENLLTQDTSQELQEAYLFLREVEMNLRIVHERPLHALPSKAPEQDKLARRLGFSRKEDQREGELLMSEYNRLAARVREMYNRILEQISG